MRVGLLGFCFPRTSLRMCNKERGACNFCRRRGEDEGVVSRAKVFSRHFCIFCDIENVKDRLGRDGVGEVSFRDRKIQTVRKDSVFVLNFLFLFYILFVIIV